MARGARDRRDEHRFPGARHRCRRVPARRGRAGSPSRRCATSSPACPTIEHVIFALRGPCRLRGVRRGARQPDRRARQAVAGGPRDHALRADRGAARRARRAGRPRDPAARPDRPGRPLPRGQPAVPAARRERDALLRSGAARRCSAASSRRRPRSWPTTPGSSSSSPGSRSTTTRSPGTPDRGRGLSRPGSMAR